MASTQVNLYEAKTQLSSLVERAAKGEEIIIAKAGKAMVKLVPILESPMPLRTFGKNILGITILSDDWEEDIPLEYFTDENGENPFLDGVGEPVEAERSDDSLQRRAKVTV